MKRLKIDVDTGSITALVSSKDPNPFQFKIPIKKGKYKIVMTVKNCWNGKVSNFNFLDVKKDSFLYFSDGFIDNNENEIKAETLFKKGCQLSTGGDGAFTLFYEIIAVKKIGQDPYLNLLKKAKVFFKKNKFSNENSTKFCDLFLSNCYYSQIVKIVENQRRKETQKILDEVEKFINNRK